MVVFQFWGLVEIELVIWREIDELAVSVAIWCLATYNVSPLVFDGIHIKLFPVRVFKSISLTFKVCTKLVYLHHPPWFPVGETSTYKDLGAVVESLLILHLLESLA